LPLVQQQSTPYPLNFQLWPRQVLQISYDPARFTAAAIQRMLTHIQQIVYNILAQPEQTMGDLCILPAEERQLLLESWSNQPITLEPELAPPGEAFPAGQVFVVDQYGQPTALGVPGELWISEPQPAPGNGNL